MLVDLHAHYPMRVVSDVTPATPKRLAKRRARQPGVKGGRLVALVLRVAAMLGNHRLPWSSYRVTPKGLRTGGVGVALSVLTRPFDEFDLTKPRGSNPLSHYYDGLLDDLAAVEGEVARHDRDMLRLVHTRAELESALQDGATALVHCVEGGFSLGDQPGEVRENVKDLATRGVVYITLAHLVYRQVATNSNAFPFASDEQLDRFYPQPGMGEGLTERGVAAITAMVEHGVLLDISHMRQDALDETWALLDRLDPELRVPVLASHVGYRFADQEYMLDDATILQVKRRNGLIGLILAQHQLMDVPGEEHVRTQDFEDSKRVIFKHIDKIAEVTGGYDHVALGTDFDGFIKPTLTGLEGMGDLTALEQALDGRYREDSAKIKSENALGLLRRAMR
jgi:microsomal dipeptidase-like Zn-dependent dipeptidase